MPSPGDPARLVARSDRLETFADRTRAALDAYVRERARDHREGHEQAGIRARASDADDSTEIEYSVVVISIQPGGDEGATKRVTTDVTEQITGTDRFETLATRRREALADAAEFRRRATAAGHSEPQQTTLKQFTG